MKKYIAVFDVVDSSITHLIELTSDMSIHAKACDDGVAMVVCDNISERIHGFTLSVEEELLPFYSELIMRGEAKTIEQGMVGDFLRCLNDFFNCNDSILFVEDTYCDSCYLSELNSFLREWKEEEERERKNSNKNSKSNNQNRMQR